MKHQLTIMTGASRGLGLALARQARRVWGWAALGLKRQPAGRSLSATLDDLREDRF